MSRLLLFVSFFISFVSVGQTIPDSTVNGLSDLNCACLDSLDINANGDSIRNHISDCYVKSLIVFVNAGELSKEYLSDQSNFNALQERVIEQLEYCSILRKLYDRFNGIPAPRDTVPDGLFIEDAFFEKHGLKKGQVSPMLRVWNMDENKHIQRVVDIRWVFETHKEALTYHEKKRDENSEDGREIQLKKKIKHVDDLHVYRENDEMSAMIAAMGIPQRQYIFLFVMDNVVFKIFVATDETLEADDLVFFVKQAVKNKRRYRD